MDFDLKRWRDNEKSNVIEGEKKRIDKFIRVVYFLFLRTAVFFTRNNIHRKFNGENKRLFYREPFLSRGRERTALPRH